MIVQQVWEPGASSHILCARTIWSDIVPLLAAGPRLPRVIKCPNPTCATYFEILSRKSDCSPCEVLENGQLGDLILITGEFC